MIAGKPTAAERAAAANAAREALKAANAEAFAEQQADDLEELVKLETEHGFERVLRVDLNGWKAGVGATTMVIVRIPTASESVFKRYEQTVTKAKPQSTTSLDAGHTLADSCWLYPTKKTAAYEATVELAAGIHTNLAVQIAKVVQGQAEEEKKE